MRAANLVPGDLERYMCRYCIVKRIICGACFQDYSRQLLVPMGSFFGLFGFGLVLVQTLQLQYPIPSSSRPHTKIFVDQIIDIRGLWRPNLFVGPRLNSRPPNQAHKQKQSKLQGRLTPDCGAGPPYQYPHRCEMRSSKFNPTNLSTDQCVQTTVVLELEGSHQEGGFRGGTQNIPITSQIWELYIQFVVMVYVSMHMSAHSTPFPVAAISLCRP